MSIAHVQDLTAASSGSTTGGTSTISCSFPAATGAGNLLVLSIGCASTTVTVSSISDGTNTWTKAAAVSANTNGPTQNEVWYAQNAASLAAAHTITVTLSGTTENAVCGAEFSGVATTSALDVTGTNSGTIANNETATATPAAAGELGFLGVSNWFPYSQIAPTVTAGTTGWTATSSGSS